MGKAPTCPHCGKEVSVFTDMAEGTVLSVEIKTEPGQRFSCREVGGVLENFGKLIEAVGDDVTQERKTVALLRSLTVNEDATCIKAEAMVVFSKSRRAKRRRKDPK